MSAEFENFGYSRQSASKPTKPMSPRRWSGTCTATRPTGCRPAGLRRHARSVLTTYPRHGV